jgi:hypothetical protein
MGRVMRREYGRVRARRRRQHQHHAEQDRPHRHPVRPEAGPLVTLEVVLMASRS